VQQGRSAERPRVSYERQQPVQQWDLIGVSDL